MYGTFMYVRTCVVSFSKAIDPHHNISNHHYNDNYKEYSYYCSNYYSIPTTFTTFIDITMFTVIYILNKYAVQWLLCVCSLGDRWCAVFLALCI